MIQILGVKMYDADIPTATKNLISIAETSQPKLNRCVSATGAHGLVHSYGNSEYKSILNSFFWNLPDGMPSVWVGKLKGAKGMKRCYGPAFFQDVIIRSRDTSIRHFFCGGKEGVASELQTRCKERFGNNRVVGTFCPPFRELTEEEWVALGELIQRSGADVVWIGLSTPKQEVFAMKLCNYCKVHFVITVGAAFDFHTDRIKFAPKWMQNAGLEWFFRLLSEPKRLYKRYFTIVPLFIIFNLVEGIHWVLNKFRK